jgi:2-oxoglutarate ferredoxin oxidoreductase subunit delta
MVKGSVTIDVDRCKGCELCTAVCPQGILQTSGNHFNARGYRPVLLVDPQGKCTGCALCALLCPDVALTVYRRQTPGHSAIHPPADVRTARVG